MGFADDLALITSQAERARAAGRPVFIARLKTSMWNQPGFGETHEWEDLVIAVESRGWRLAHWSVSTDQSGSMHAWPLFRLASSFATGPVTPQDSVY